MKVQLQGRNFRLALQAIENALTDGRQISVSTISEWELAILVAKDKMALSKDVSGWPLYACGSVDANSVPVDNEMPLKAQKYEVISFPLRPRIIVVAALKLATSLLTADDQHRSYNGDLSTHT